VKEDTLIRAKKMRREVLDSIAFGVEDGWHMLSVRGVVC
jgi:hypothetical protein